jgi:uncharacterized protein (TIGR02246 family)
MKAKALLIVAVGLFGVSVVRADDAATKEVEKAIQALNEAFTKHDAAAIKRLTVEEHVAITPYYNGPATIAEQLKMLAEFKTTEYQVAQQQIRLIAKDTALVTYQLTQKGTYKGKELLPKNYASAVWVNRNGKWLEAFYQETALEGK